MATSYTSSSSSNYASTFLGTGMTFSTNVCMRPTKKSKTIVVSNGFFGETDKGFNGEVRVGHIEPNQWRPGITLEDMNNFVMLTPTDNCGIVSCYHYYNGKTFKAKPAVLHDLPKSAVQPYRAWLSSPIFVDTFGVKK